jgi:hypothetical protein
MICLPQQVNLSVPLPLKMQTAMHDINTSAGGPALVFSILSTKLLSNGSPSIKIQWKQPCAVHHLLLLTE